ncbi:MAG: methylmalonyl-CoA epimerase [Bacilli bacterium]|nr:methylmalonyl-CoA epimerase [Bacilli bacterium]
MIKLTKLDHIGIAVRSIEDALPLYTGLFTLSVQHEEIIEEQGVRSVFLPVGGNLIELLEPTNAQSPIARFLDKRGQGIHHMAYLVEDLEQSIAAAKADGYRLIDETPRTGGHGKRIAFLHPSTTSGVLIEFCEHHVT